MITLFERYVNSSNNLPTYHLLRRNRQRIRKIPLKSLISEGFWSEWGDSNARSLEPKSSAIPTSLHPVIEFFIRLGVFSQTKRDTNFAIPGYY